MMACCRGVGTAALFLSVETIFVETAAAAEVLHALRYAAAVLLLLQRFFAVLAPPLKLDLRHTKKNTAAIIIHQNVALLTRSCVFFSPSI